MNGEFALRGTLVDAGREIRDGLVVVGAGKIRYAGPIGEYRQALPQQLTIVAEGWICPGFVDIHMHGIGGFDTMDGTPDALKVISRALARHGVTSFLATTMTAPYGELERVLKNLAAMSRGGLEGAQLAGIHLEGPWINPRCRGAHREADIVPPSLQDVRRLYEQAEGLIRMVTLAPEQPGALEAIAWLKDRGVICSCGHSGASFALIERAVAAGLSHFTHCFNAMTGMHHREPGVVGAAMYHEQLSADLIADGIHVHPAVMRILCRVKTASRLVLISDAMRAATLGEGRYELGGQEVEVRNGEARLADGTLAGSLLTLNRAVGNMVTLCGIPLADAVRMAAQTPAEILGLGGKKGRLAAGWDADLIVLGPRFEIVRTYVAGKEVFRANR